MADTNVGQVSMDLILNSKQFKNQLNTAVNNAVKGTSQNTSKLISGTFGKIGKLAAATFAVGSIVKFGKACLDLGSDLTEVQNVVDVAFGSMSSDIDKFASTAITKFGLSETVAKRYAGTFGAMATSIGFTTEEAVEMSKTLTGLAGDVASFYNMTSDEAYTKLKGVFTGETQALMEIGVVMTQANLDQFALQKGYGKTTKAMDQQEKTALRYAFVQDRLKNATGDFIRTQDGWANQTRVLKLQWDSFKAALGKGLINVLTPMIKLINLLMVKLVQLANVFKSFTESIFGDASKNNGASAIASDMSELASNTEGVGDAAEGTAKQIKKSLMGFDQLNTLSDNSDTGAGGGASGIDIPSIDTSLINDEIDKTEKKTSVLVTTLKELGKIFSNGFKIGINGANFDNILTSVKNIGKEVKSIFTDKEVLKSGETFANKYLTALGKATGSAANVGITIGELIVGGFEKFISTKGNRIKSYIKNMFDITGDIAEIQGNLTVAVADILSVFKSESAKKLLGNLLSILGEVGMTVNELSLKIGRDIIDGITKPIIANKDKFKQAFQGILDVYAQVSGAIEEVVTNVMSSINQTYDEHIRPLIQSLRDGLTDIAGTFLDVWNSHIQPVLQSMGDKMSEVWLNNIQPALLELSKLLGKVADLVKAIWENPLKPIVQWLIKNVVPFLVDFFKWLWDIQMWVFGLTFDIIKAVISTLGGLIDFLVGVFTGDWEKMWTGIKDIFKGVFDIILALFGTNCDKLGETFRNIGEKLKATASNIVNGIKDFFVNGFNNLVNALKTPVNNILSIFNKMIDRVNSLSFDLPDWVPLVGGESLGFTIPHLPMLANGGYVAANTPQLAIVGDNKHEGEIIAPESKITEAVAQAMTPVIMAIQQLVAKVGNGDNGGDITIPIILDGNILDNVIVSANSRKALRTGGR